MEELLKTDSNGQWELSKAEDGHVTKHPDGSYVIVASAGASKVSRKQAATAIQDGKKWTYDTTKLPAIHQEHIKKLK